LARNAIGWIRIAFNTVYNVHIMRVNEAQLYYRVTKRSYFMTEFCRLHTDPSHDSVVTLE